jgi:hypothetical protein
LGYLRAAQDPLKLNRSKKLLPSPKEVLMPIRSTLIFTVSLARPSAPGTNTIDHSKALIKNQPDSIEGHKRTAQDLLKLGQRDKAISIIEQ